MRTKIKVDILKQGKNNQSILRAITSHNEGSVLISESDLISYATMQRAIYPNAEEGFFIQRQEENENILTVTEDNGESCTLELTFIELHELEGKGETDADDLKEVFQSVESRTGGDNHPPN